MKNPIIRGFHPDPSIIRVKEDYYIATSTFEWFPGVCLYHSRDLEHWEQLPSPLNRISQLDMKGNKSSAGVYAPCLSYDNGIYYLVYTDTKNHSGLFWDCHNYLVTAKDPAGEWSDPVELNSSGFDPSLFHDKDGRKWLVNMTFDYRKGDIQKNYPLWSGIVLQEYDPESRKLVGKSEIICKGTEIGTVEGPHLYYHDGYYYLLCAEGGTFEGHAVTLARSRNIWGPYETNPGNPILTSRNDCTLKLQRAGHADIVEAHNGKWYMVYLCSRPLPSRGGSVMGRETAIQEVQWNQAGWLETVNGTGTPDEAFESGLKEEAYERKEFWNFHTKELPIGFQTLRIPMKEYIRLDERPGYLRLYGRESLSSDNSNVMTARRQEEFCFTAETKMEFQPQNYFQMAGITYFYDTMNHFYLFISADDDGKGVINLYHNDMGNYHFPMGREGIPISDEGAVWLKMMVYYDRISFYWSLDGEKYEQAADSLYCGDMTDEAYRRVSQERFTGSFVGMACQNCYEGDCYADFEWFAYKQGNKE